ncbi:MAG: hypothetical protein NTY16_01750 [Deltaproteobacteria bacterium]|nr:hypothetical protein [Deltaproteobacteria bacterium]
MLDHFGFPRSAIGLWLARTFAGEGESIFEGINAVGRLFKPPVLWQRSDRVRSMTRHDPTLD